jgi:hypothetical protein
VSTLRKIGWLQTAYHFLSMQVIPLLFAIPAALVGVLILPFFIPKFYRQAIRRHRYKLRGGPDDSTPVPRIPRAPLQSQPDAVAKQMPDDAPIEAAPQAEAVMT